MPWQHSVPLVVILKGDRSAPLTETFLTETLYVRSVTSLDTNTGFSHWMNREELLPGSTSSMEGT